MAEPKWEQQKMKERYRSVSIDELVIFLIGVVVFAFNVFKHYQLFYIGLVIIWYWLKIRRVETKIYQKRQEIYNTYYDQIGYAPQEIIDKRTTKAREPMQYQLEQYEQQRKSLIDKFVVINLILVILIQLFITN